MESFDPDQLMLIIFAIAIPVLFVFYKRVSKIFAELAMHYNGKVYRPYLGIAMGVEIPFANEPVIFDPYGLFMARGRNDNRSKRPSLIWKLSENFGLKTIYIERGKSGLTFSPLALAKKVRTNDVVFDQEFNVICRDEAQALQFLSSELREALMAKRDMIYALEIERSHLFLRHKDVLRNTEQFRQFIDEGLGLMDQIRKLSGQ